MFNEQSMSPVVPSMLGDPVLPSPSRNSSPRTSSPKSQVRFSVPDTSLPEVSQAPVLGSPSKIVFPKSFEEEDASESASEDIGNGIHNLSNEGHFMDIHSRIMVNIPAEIWNFHTKRRLAKQHRKSRSTGDQSSCHNNQDMEMSRQVQSIIVDTLDSMGRTHYDDFSGKNQESPSSLQQDNNNGLYLTSYSPLNGYNVPVPLEISLPPYLSPKNRGRKRRTLIFDGKSYSPFHKNADENTSRDDEEDGDALGQVSHLSADTEEDLSISADSIPSAVHDISFDVNSLNDVDREFGIDEHANVDLRVQRRNLKSEHFPRLSSSFVGGPGILDGLSSDEDDSDISDHESQDLMDRKKSLDILATPLKQIHIPDFDLEPPPSSTSTVGSLNFFDRLEREEKESRPNPHREVDKLDMNFKFPILPPKEDDDFIKTYNTPTDPRFEARRNRMIEQKASPSRGRRDMHNRNRSIRSVQDMFSTSTPSQAATSVFPNRSAPPKNYSISEGTHGQEEQVSSRASRGRFAEDEYGLPFIKFNSDVPADLPATPSRMGGGRQELMMSPAPLFRTNCNEPITPVSVEHSKRKASLTLKSPTHTGLPSRYQGLCGLQKQYACENKGTVGDDGRSVSDNQSIRDGNNKSLGIMPEDTLLCGPEEIQVNELPAPLKEITPPIQNFGAVQRQTSIQSSTASLDPTDNEYANIVSTDPEPLSANGCLLSPIRSISNTDSQSSTNSQFSKQTQSSRASYPNELEVANGLEGKSKPPISRPLSYHSDQVSNNTAKSQYPPPEIYRTDDVFDDDNVVSHREFYKEVISPDGDKKHTKNLPGEYVPLHKDSLAARGCNKSQSVLLADATHQWNSTLCDEKKVHVSQRPKTFGGYAQQPSAHNYKDMYDKWQYHHHQNARLEQHQYGLCESINYDTLDHQEHNHSSGKYNDEGGHEKQVNSASYKQQLAPSSEFHEVLETLDNMVSPPRRTTSVPLEEYGSEPSLEVKSKKESTVDRRYRTQCQEEDGKLVEDLVPDDNSKDNVRRMADKHKLSHKGLLRSKSPSKNREDILKMCEDTASRARDVIFQLVDDKESKSTRKRKSTRPLPPVTTKEMARLSHMHHRSLRNHRSATDSFISEEGYLKNLIKAVQPKAGLE